MDKESLNQLLIVGITPYFLEKQGFWFEENLQKLLDARRTHNFFEDNIIFLWISISELSHYRILPESIIDMIKKWQEGSNNIWQQ